MNAQQRYQAIYNNQEQIRARAVRLNQAYLDDKPLDKQEIHILCLDTLMILDSFQGYDWSPKELAAMLGISPKTLRAWLRLKFGREHVWHGRWHINREMIEAAIVRFAA